MYLDYRDNGNSYSKPDVSTFNTLLKAWAYVSAKRKQKACDKVEEIVARMAEWDDVGALDNVAPNVISYTTMMLCYGLSRTPGAPERCDKILELMDDLHRRGKLREGPNKTTFHTLRKAWSFSNHPDKQRRVDEIHQEMERRFGSASA